MIRGVHTMFYSSDAPATRAFLRDVLGFSRVTDVGDGWLIFDLPESDMGVHPSAIPGRPTDGHDAPGTHNISFYCDDIRQTVAELKQRGVDFTAPVTDEGFGLVTHFNIPGGINVQLYQPRYTKGGGG